MSRLAFVFLVFSATSACVVGDPTVGSPGPSGGAPDAGEDPGPGADAGPSVCEPIAATVPAGHHNAGTACLTCHDGNMADAPLWTLAGTLYTSGAGTTALPGATIVVTDNAGSEIKMIAGDNGNFFTSQTVVFPIHAKASGCPNETSMQNAQQVGDCNSCHSGQSHIHLP